MGRVRAEKWGPRVIDVDLLLYRGIAVNEADLVLPHPYMGERAFVLAPLLDIAPDLRIGGKKRQRDLCRYRPQSALNRSIEMAVQKSKAPRG